MYPSQPPAKSAPAAAPQAPPAPATYLPQYAAPVPVYAQAYAPVMYQPMAPVAAAAGPGGAAVLYPDDDHLTDDHHAVSQQQVYGGAAAAVAAGATYHVPLVAHGAPAPGPEDDSPFRQLRGDEWMEAVSRRPYRVNVEAYTSTAWNLVKANLGPTIWFMVFCTLLLVGVALAAIYLILGMSEDIDWDWDYYEDQYESGYTPEEIWEGASEDFNEDLFYFRFILLVVLLGASALVAKPLLTGLYTAGFKAVSGRQVKFGDFFGGFRYFCSLLLIVILEAIPRAIFFPLGIVASILLCFSILVLIDHPELGIIKSIKTSAKVVSMNFLGITWLLFCEILLAFVGIFAFGFGLWLTIPLAGFMHCVAYKHIFGLHGVLEVVASVV